MRAEASPAVPRLDAACQVAFQQLIEERYGFRLAAHRSTELDRAVQTLLPKGRYPDAGELYRALSSGKRLDLLEALVAALTVGETHFFRVRPQIEALRRDVLPDLIRQRREVRRLRCWSAGCSTGEEAYTLAILLRECLPANEHWDSRLLATDISRPALDAARAAVYGGWSFRDTPEMVRRCYFTREGQHWQLAEAIKTQVRFVYLNLTESFPPGTVGTDIDLILCRNVTIYFSAEATQELYKRFAAVLAPGGWLVLGPSDPTPEQEGLLKQVYLPGVVLWRRREAGEDRRPAPKGRVAVSGTVPRSSPAQAAPAIRFSRRLEDLGQAKMRPQSGSRIARQGTEGSTHISAEQAQGAQVPEAAGHLALGMAALDTGAINAAVGHLRSAAFLDPEQALTQFGLGRAYLLQGEPSRARAALHHARRLLAPLPDEAPVPAAPDTTVGALRLAVDAELANAQRRGTPIESGHVAVT